MSQKRITYTCPNCKNTLNVPEAKNIVLYCSMCGTVMEATS